MGLEVDLTELNAKLRVILRMQQETLGMMKIGSRPDGTRYLDARFDAAGDAHVARGNRLSFDALLFVHTQDSLAPLRNNDFTADGIARTLSLRDAKKSFDGDNWMLDAEGKEIADEIMRMSHAFKELVLKKDELYPAYRV